MGTEQIEHWSDNMDAKAASVRLAFAAWRYALGGKDREIPIHECIKWLQILEAQK